MLDHAPDGSSEVEARKQIERSGACDFAIHLCDEQMVVRTRLDLCQDFPLALAQRFQRPPPACAPGRELFIESKDPRQIPFAGLANDCLRRIDHHPSPFWFLAKKVGCESLVRGVEAYSTVELVRAVPPIVAHQRDSVASRLPCQTDGLRHQRLAVALAALVGVNDD